MIFAKFFKFPGGKNIGKHWNINSYDVYTDHRYCKSSLVWIIGYASLHKEFKKSTIVFNAESKDLQTWAGNLATSRKMPNYSKIDCYTWKKFSDYKISASKEDTHIIDLN